MYGEPFCVPVPKIRKHYVLSMQRARNLYKIVLQHMRVTLNMNLSNKGIKTEVLPEYAIYFRV